MYIMVTRFAVHVTLAVTWTRSLRPEKCDSLMNTVYNRTGLKIGGANICTPKTSIAAYKHSGSMKNIDTYKEISVYSAFFFFFFGIVERSRYSSPVLVSFSHIMMQLFCGHHLVLQNQ